MKEKFNYPLEIMKDRKKFIDKEISTNGNLSVNNYNILLKQIGVDIYDSINNLKEWNSFTIKGSLYVRGTLGIFIPRKRELRKMILLGLDSGKVVFDNYKRVLEGLDITNDTKDNTKGILNICLNYGGDYEIVDMTKKIAKKVLDGTIKVEDITKEVVSKNLYQDLPPLDFVIRTSGEMRISNFMIYQSSYTEYDFPDIYFPDYDSKCLEKSLDCYRKRNRRFGDA